MVHALSRNEGISGPARRRRSPRRAELHAAVDRIVDHGDASTLAHVLDFLVDAGRRDVDLPQDELRLWESVGARFDDDPRLRAQSRVTLGEAIAELERVSYHGVADFARAMGVSPSRVSQLVGDGSVIVWRTADADVMFPKWQLDRAKRLHGLEKVARAIRPGVHPVNVHRWATSSNVDLQIGGASVSPRDWLASGGDPEQAARLAAQL